MRANLLESTRFNFFMLRIQKCLLKEIMQIQIENINFILDKKLFWAKLNRKSAHCWGFFRNKSLLFFYPLKKMREVLTIEVGQAGIQLGNAIWEQYCAEHGIDNSGKRKENVAKMIPSKCSFEETGSGQFVPRNLAVEVRVTCILLASGQFDLEPNVIDVKNGPFAAMFHPEFLVHSKEDAANNFARGHYTIGKQIIDKVNDRLRKLVDNCDNVMGFVIGHSVGGGTGSGLGALILERLTVDYRKKPKLGFEIYPSPNLSACVVERYNSLLATHWLLDHTEVSLLLDNKAIYGICQKQLRIAKPDVNNLNRLISKVISSMTASLRFSGELNVDLNEFQTNLVPFPRLHFMTTGMSPIIPKADTGTAPNDVQKITDDYFKPANWFMKFTEFDPAEDKYMAISLNY
ncbi:tubulin alpha-3 chain [Reticulomyxa filosa]|uniref:Tubulin alpha chain n=1 Tax=Reticulomyxa filosa TaxID=46433 RepID=X6N7U5_RETFI|nr:tubulin alpha-3 chain [Reticulomyxa filosa]|eukprot:ETO21824.1 tubulin alpha-3 chain [Reticulomyxa filosa]